MRLIKMFGLTALAAVAAMAFIGASSASATNTALCKVHTEPCPAGSLVTSVHMVNKGNLILEAKFIGTITVTCTGSLGKANVLGLGKPQVAHIEELTWSGCTSSGSPCTVTTEVKGLFNILKSVLNLGTAEAVNTEVHVECSGIINCFYTANGKALALEGSGHTAGAGNGMLSANKLVVNQTKGAFCPSTSTWTALYEPLEKIFGVS